MEFMENKGETPGSDSDSGDSLFFTQSVTSASRTVKRRRPSLACLLGQESEDEWERDKDSNSQREDTRASSDSDSESSYANLLRRQESPGVKTRGRSGQRLRTERLEFPFLKKSVSRQLSVRKNQTVVNSKIGGFFKCISKLSGGHGEQRRRELSPSILSSELEQNSMEESADDDDWDIRKADTERFIWSAAKPTNRLTWLPSLTWKTNQTPREFSEQGNKHQEQQEKCYQTRKVAEDLTEPHNYLDIHKEGSTFNVEESQSRKKEEKSRARSSLSPLSSPCHLSPDKSPFVRSLFTDHQGEHSENQPQVLVTCSQSINWHQTQKTSQAPENVMSPIDEMAVEETQWPSLAEQDEDETQILEDNPTERDGEKDAVCLENISFQDHQVQDEDFHEGVHHELLENEKSEGFSSSQDLFEEPNNQASPLKETSVENNNEEVLESHAALHDDIDSIKKKKKKGSLVLTDVEDDYVKNSESQRTQLSELISPTSGDIHQKRKAKDNKTLDDSVEHANPSMPLEDYVSGSTGNVHSSPSKDSLMVRQEKKTETPLFVYGGLKFLKRKKVKKTKAPEISDNLASKPGPTKNEDFAPHFDDIVKRKKRKKLKNIGSLEEPVDTLPEISVPADLILSVQNSSVGCASVGGSKPKKKRKKDKSNGLLVEPDDILPEISVPADSYLSVQDSSVVCASVGGSKPKKKRKKYKSNGFLVEPDETLPEMSNPADSNLSVQDSLVFRASLSGAKPKKKRKKDKSNGFLVEPGDTLPKISNPADSNLSVQDSLVVCTSVGGSKPKKKRKKDKSNGFLVEPDDTLPEISVPADSYLSVQDSSVVCASVGESKPKKKRKKDKHGQPVPPEDQLIGVEEAFQIPCQGPASLVSIPEETEQLTRTDLSSPCMSQDVNQLDISTQINKDLVQSVGCESRKKKKKAAKNRDSCPMISDEMVAPQWSEESHLSNGTKTVKKKKHKFIDDVGEGQVGEMVMGSKNLGESLKKILEMPPGVEIQRVNSVELKTHDSVTPKKKKKRKHQEVVREENVDNESSLVETTEQVKTPDNIQDSEQQAAEVVLVRKLKKQKKKRDRTETHQEEEAAKNASVSFELGQIGISNTPSIRSETGAIGGDEGLGGSESVKKKKKKRRKEPESDGSWSVSHCGFPNTEQTTVVKDASGSGQNLGQEYPAPCLEMQLTNDSDEKKKHERTTSGISESSQQVLQSEDTIQSKEKKKKKKKIKKEEEEERSVETDMCPELVEHDACQESGSPSEPSEAKIEKKKKKKIKKNSEDTVDRGENEMLDVVPELHEADKPRDVIKCHAKEENISCSGDELLVKVKKKKKKKLVRDSDNDLGATAGSEQVTVPGESNQCSQTHSAKKKKKRKRDHL